MVTDIAALRFELRGQATIDQERLAAREGGGKR